MAPAPPPQAPSEGATRLAVAYVVEMLGLLEFELRVVGSGSPTGETRPPRRPAQHQSGHEFLTHARSKSLPCADWLAGDARSSGILAPGKSCDNPHDCKQNTNTSFGFHISSGRARAASNDRPPTLCFNTNTRGSPSGVLIGLIAIYKRSSRG